MISEFFINCGFGILEGALSMLPDITWSVDTTAWQYAKDFVDMICYLLPIGTVKQILSMIVAITFFRIGIAFIRTIWSFIPFV